jgi:hypothetical protein
LNIVQQTSKRGLTIEILQANQGVTFAGKRKTTRFSGGFV